MMLVLSSPSFLKGKKFFSGFVFYYSITLFLCRRFFHFLGCYFCFLTKVVFGGKIDILPKTL